MLGWRFPCLPPGSHRSYASYHHDRPREHQSWQAGAISSTRALQCSRTIPTSCIPPLTAAGPTWGAPFMRQKRSPLALCCTHATVYLSTGLKGVNLQAPGRECEVARVLPASAFSRQGFKVAGAEAGCKCQTTGLSGSTSGVRVSQRGNITGWRAREMLSNEYAARAWHEVVNSGSS